MQFGRYSTVLAIAVANGWLLALLLWNVGRQRVFLRPLAALVAVIALRLMPYVLGFAGAYDTWHWLTFAPFDLSFAFGPLAWGYVVALSTGALPPRWRWHLAPATAQLAYQLVAFALPVEAKWNWYTTGHRNIVEPIGLALAVVSLGAYVTAGWTQFARWQRWMDENLSNREAFRLGVVRVVLIGTAVVTTLAAAFALRSWLVAPTDYFDRFPMVLALALLAYVLGLSGWRQSAMTYPVIPTSTDRAIADARQPLPDLPPEGPSPPELTKVTGRPRQDYATLGAQWQRNVVAERWYRDPSLTLATFAQRLNVSPRTASRVLSEGLGCTFNAFINRMRVDEVVQRIHDPHNTMDLLPLALGAGFASKASFNRAFREVTGTSPGAIRAAAMPHGSD